MTDINHLPVELWNLIFGHEVLLNYNQLLYFLNKRVYKFVKILIML